MKHTVPVVGEAEKLCQQHEMKIQEAPVTSIPVDAGNTVQKSPESIYIKEEEPDYNLEHVVVKVEQPDEQQEHQDTASSDIFTVVCKKEDLSVTDGGSGVGRLEETSRIEGSDPNIPYEPKAVEKLNGATHVSNKKEFNCDLCDYCCARKTSLKLHQLSKHNLGKPFKCELCDFSCVVKSTLVNHLCSKHGIGEPLKCDFCKFSCTRTTAMKAHKASKHGVDHLKRHQAAKHGINDLHCKLCDYSSARKSYMKQHRANKHGIGRIIKCDLCDYTCAYVSYLKQHLASQHSTGVLH
ncbi:Zinc finger C2H2-type [Trinorchestia longiramus]|nr:Zinc finger C2H2-type [Trinorchestia longiramus]